MVFCYQKTKGSESLKPKDQLNPIVELDGNGSENQVIKGSELLK